MAYGILAGAVSGGSKATKEVAEGRIQSSLDEKKAQALEKKQTNMLRLQQAFQTGEREAGQTFKTGERIAGEEAKTTEGILARESTEGIATGRTESAERIAGMKTEGKHKFSAPQMAAITKIQEMIAEGASLENVNYVAKAAGLGQFKETETGEMVEIPDTGFFGYFMEKEPGKKIVPADTPGGAKTFDELMEGIDKISNGFDYDVGESQFGMDAVLGEEKEVVPEEKGILAQRAEFPTEKPPEKEIEDDTETYAKKVMREGVKGVTETGEWKGTPVGEKRGKPMVFRNGKWEYMKRTERKEYEASKG